MSLVIITNVNKEEWAQQGQKPVDNIQNQFSFQLP